MEIPNLKFTLKKNKFKKEGTQQPDYRINLKIDDAWVDAGACWLKSDKNGNKYLSCEMKPQEKKVEDQNTIEL